MPEGDTIFRTAESLRAALQGKRVVAARPPSLRRLVGTTISDVAPVGKHLLMRFDNGLALHTHMRMRGVWHVYRRGEPWRRPQWQLKVLLETEDVVAACFAAPVVDLVRDESTKVGHLGPDILGADFDVGEVLKRARAADVRTVGELLLEQRVAAGIGNVYRCETLWERKINPWTPPSQLSDEQLTSLFEVARKAMLASLEAGRAREAVHGRAGRPCPRCGALIRVRSQGVEHTRAVYWCPRCQP